MPYWRLSTFYLLYFAALGTLAPYWSLYLKSLDFDAVAIGQLMAIPMATKFIAPFVWGWLGDHLGHRMLIVRLGTMLTAAMFVSVFWLYGFWELGLAMVLFSFFWNAVLPQFEVVTLRHLGARVSEYARIRLWGSVGFIVTVVIVGMLVDLQGPAVILPVLFGIYLALWISSMIVKDPDPAAHPTSQPSILSLLKLPAVIAFFVVCFLMQTGHGVYYAFYSIYMESVGYTKTVIGQLWALGVIAEVVVFLFMHRVLQRWGARKVLMVSLLLAAVRWLLIGNFPDSISLILTAQVLHAATFGSFHAASIHLVNHYFTGRHQGRGQALYSGLSYGAGGAVGTLASGFLWDSAGPAITYGISAFISLLAMVIAWRYVADSIE